MKKLPYKEGSWFSMPLRGREGYAVGLVARMAPKGKIILIYLFNKLYSSIPTLNEVSLFQPKDAIKCVRAGDLGLLNGEWPIIGCSENWLSEDWPFPLFLRKEGLLGRTFRIIYNESDPSKIEREELVSDESEKLEENQLYGCGAVEILMTRLLN